MLGMQTKKKKPERKRREKIKKVRERKRREKPFVSVWLFCCSDDVLIQAQA